MVCDRTYHTIQDAKQNLNFTRHMVSGPIKRFRNPKIVSSQATYQIIIILILNKKNQRTLNTNSRIFSSRNEEVAVRNVHH